jgi:hypothetical protein
VAFPPLVDQHQHHHGSAAGDVGDFSGIAEALPYADEADVKLNSAGVQGVVEDGPTAVQRPPSVGSLSLAALAALPDAELDRLWQDAATQPAAGSLSDALVEADMRDQSRTVFDVLRMNEETKIRGGKRRITRQMNQWQRQARSQARDFGQKRAQVRLPKSLLRIAQGQATADEVFAPPPSDGRNVHRTYYRGSRPPVLAAPPQSFEAWYDDAPGPSPQGWTNVPAQQARVQQPRRRFMVEMKTRLPRSTTS